MDDSTPARGGTGGRPDGERPSGVPRGTSVGVALEATEGRAGTARCGIRRKEGAIMTAVAATAAGQTAAGKGLAGALRAAWDSAPPHRTRVARETAGATGIAILPLPFRSPESMPREDVWRGMKRVAAANRAFADVDELAQRGVSWLDDRPSGEILRIAGLRSPKFDCLST